MEKNRSLKKILSSFLVFGLFLALFTACAALFRLDKTQAYADGETLTWYHDKGSLKEEISDGYEMQFQSAVNDAKHIIAKCGEIIYGYKSGLTITNENGDVVSAVSAVGRYTFTVAEGEHAGETLTISVVPTKINLADSYNLKWVKNSREPNSGTVYIYEYTENGSKQSYYTTSPLSQAPVSSWTDWSLKSQTYVTYSIIGMRADVNGTPATYKLEPQLSLLVREECETVALSGNTANGMGQYTATYTLKPKNENYVFYFDAEEDRISYSPNAGLGGKANEDGSVILTKVWYVARHENELLDLDKTKEEASEVAFSMKGWAFGQTPENAKFPYLRAGDEWRVNAPQKDGCELITGGQVLVMLSGEEWHWNKDLQENYASGEADYVTFTLTKDGEEICKNQPRAKWAHYINRFTPAGNYTVVFSCATIELNHHNTWWNESLGYDDNLEYRAFTREYAFEVAAQTVQATGFLENDGVELDLDAFFKAPSLLSESLSAKLFYDEFLSWEQVKDSDTYWSTAEKYYDSAPVFSFCLDRQEGEYIPIEGDWSGLVPATYTVFYRIRMNNYYVELETEDDSFSLIVYRELDVPGLAADKLVYTGEEQKVALKTESALYVLSENAATIAGEYLALCTLTDSVHYKWKDAQGRSAELPFTIEKAAVRVPDAVESKYTGRPQRARIDVQKDARGNELYTAVYPANREDGFTDAGEYWILLKLLDAKNYYWVNANGEKIEDDATVTFRITEGAKGLSPAIIATICVCAGAVLIFGGVAGGVIYRRKRRKVK